jgi:hypothetical protein
MNFQYRLPIGIAYDLVPSSFKVLSVCFFSMGVVPDILLMEVRAGSEGNHWQESLTVWWAGA